MRAPTQQAQPAAHPQPAPVHQHHPGSPYLLRAVVAFCTVWLAASMALMTGGLWETSWKKENTKGSLSSPYTYLQGGAGWIKSSNFWGEYTLIQDVP